MVLLALLIGLVLGVPFGLLLRGLCEANGEDGVVTDTLSGLTFRGIPGGVVNLPVMAPVANGRHATLVGLWPECRHCGRSMPTGEGHPG